MLIILLMAFFVSAEWVEISQNHYRKEPFRNVIHFSDITTAKSNLYNNQSVTEHQWSKGYVDRVPGRGDAQRQKIQAVERKPIAKIDKNPFHREDLITMDTPRRRVQINNMKSENSIRNNIKHKSQDNTSYVQRTQQSNIKDDHRVNNENISKNKITNEKNNENNNKVIEIKTVNSNKLTTTDVFELINTDSENLSEILQQDLPETNKENVQTNTRDKNVQEKNKKFSSQEEKISPKDENKRNKTNNHGMDTLIRVLKIVSQTIQRGTRRRFGDKVRYLEDLKMSLLASINERIEAVFPDDAAPQRRRRSSDFNDSRGHVEFPSSESALMTISFLTFAVFLIKLVLQVIHTYKAKTMMVTPAVVATVGRAGNVFSNPSKN